jgi:hypothetical protein
MALTVIPTHMILRPVNGERIFGPIERAALRSITRSLLRELGEQHDHTIGADARAVVSQRMWDLRNELVAALRGEPAAIEALSIRTCDPMPL